VTRTGRVFRVCTVTDAGPRWSSIHDQHSENPDLSAIAYEAQVEILVAETIQAAGVMPDDAAHAFDTAEIGYYEAELKSLRDAATTLKEAEQHPQ
jgi:hypothetical protein